MVHRGGADNVMFACVTHRMLCCATFMHEHMEWYGVQGWGGVFFFSDKHATDATLLIRLQATNVLKGWWHICTLTSVRYRRQGSVRFLNT